jgi:hypothetical protein
MHLLPHLARDLFLPASCCWCELAPSARTTAPTASCQLATNETAGLYIPRKTAAMRMKTVRPFVRPSSNNAPEVPQRTPPDLRR